MGRSLGSSAAPAPPPPPPHGRSTGQAGLVKILAFINVVTSPRPLEKPALHRGYVDLTLRLGPLQRAPPSPAAETSERECSQAKEGAARAAAKESTEITTSGQEDKKEAEEEWEAGDQEAVPGPELEPESFGQTSERGSLDLLLQAVHVVLGGFFEETDIDDGRSNSTPEAAAATAPAREAKRKRTMAWRSLPYEVEEGTAPVVRSKRGRNQTLPSRYRDSVLEPWSKAAKSAPYGRASSKY